jgi:hypothetical protein
LVQEHAHATAPIGDHQIRTAACVQIGERDGIRVLPDGVHLGRLERAVSVATTDLDIVGGVVGLVATGGNEVGASVSIDVRDGYGVAAIRKRRRRRQRSERPVASPADMTTSENAGNSTHALSEMYIRGPHETASPLVASPAELDEQAPADPSVDNAPTSQPARARLMAESRDSIRPPR